MSNIIIVESKNDKAFFEALINHLNLESSQIKIDAPICNIDDIQCLEGLNQTKLTEHIEGLRNDLVKKDISAVGVILDHDGKKVERYEMVNQAFHSVFHIERQIQSSNRLIDVKAKVEEDYFDIKIGCCLTGVDDKGELETLLKAIKTKSSGHADCLTAWLECVKENGFNISEKDFDKFWLNNYIRFDTCSKKEKKRMARKCSMLHFEYIMQEKKEIFDFNHILLNELTFFLQLFQ